MPAFPKSGAVLFGKELPRLAKFYEAVVGFSVVHSEAGIIVLESGQQQLVLHGVPLRVAKSIEITSPPKLRTDTAVKLVFVVDSIADARSSAGAFGGALSPKEKEFEVRGSTACDGYDPEGNVIQFRENVL
jgi:predicted enzyme related to lactoylglutathione lyase